MDRYLITQSLLSSWLYTFNCADSAAEDARAEFLDALNRVPKETTEAMQNGIDFERACYQAAAGKPLPRDRKIDKWAPGITEVSKIIQGAPVQVRLSRELELDGMTFLVYGILDALKAGVIYDVKFLNKSMGGSENGPYLPGKYLESPQHPAYFYLVPEAIEFRYLVSDGTDLYIETYRREDTPFIGDIIREFIASITSMGLLDIYRGKWLAK